MTQDSSSIEQLMSGDHAPLPAAQIGSSDDVDNHRINEKEINSQKNASSIEVLSDGDAPMPNESIDKRKIEDYSDKKNTTGMMEIIHPEQMPSESPPMPTLHDGDGMDEKKKAESMQPSIVMMRQHSNATVEFNAADRESSLFRVENNQITCRQAHFLNANASSASSSQNDETQARGISNRDIEAQSQTNVSSLGNTSLNPSVIDLDASTPVIPEAFLVEDFDENEVAIAEVVLPWWKRKRFYAAIFIILLIFISSIVGGVKYVQLSSSRKEIVFLTNETTTAPSLSSAPTSSTMPSFQPSACVDRSSLDPERLEFPYFDLTRPMTAIEGEHSVIVDIHMEEQRVGVFSHGSVSIHVVFYKLTKLGTWDKTQHFKEFLFIEHYYKEDWNYDNDYSLALSRNTAFVGSPSAMNGNGIVYTYEFNAKLGEWQRMNEITKPDDRNNHNGSFGDDQDNHNKRFGQMVAIDDDLAIITAFDGDLRVCEIYFYQQVELTSSWNHVTTIAITGYVSDVVISGNTIGIQIGCQVYLYIYNRNLMTAKLTQQFDVCPGDIALAKNHLAFSGINGGDIALYTRPDESTNFTLLQMLNSSTDDTDRSYYQLALDDDFLVVEGPGNPYSHAFVFSNGYWEESFVLDPPDDFALGEYNRFRLDISQWRVLSTASEEYDMIYIYDVNECASMPSPSPDETPPSNTTITTCFMIDIFVQYFWEREPSWTVERVNETDSQELSSSVPTLSPTLFATYKYNYGENWNPSDWKIIRERKCLEEGTYDFVIYKNPLFYNITSYGSLIVGGYSPGYRQSTKFQIPFTYMPTNSPSSNPSYEPSQSWSPTITCTGFIIEIFAEHFSGLFSKWTVHQVNETDATLLPTWFAKSNEEVYEGKGLSSLSITKERRCLQEGTYQFAIKHSPPIFYNITSNGNLIADSHGPTGYIQSIQFHVPFTYMPSEVPSSNPSYMPSETWNPTAACFMVRIFAQHYRGNVPKWTIEPVDETDIQEISPLIPTLRPTWHTSLDADFVGLGPVSLTFTREDKCLEEGTFQITIYNNPLFYNVTSNGNLIKEGHEPGYETSITFHVPSL